MAVPVGSQGLHHSVTQASPALTPDGCWRVWKLSSINLGSSASRSNFGPLNHRSGCRSSSRGCRWLTSLSLAGTGGTAEESDIKIIKHSAAFRWPMAAPVVTSYTVGFLRLFDPFLADFSGSLLCGEGVKSCEFTTFHNVDCAKPDHLRTQPLSQCKWFVKVWCESPGSTSLDCAFSFVALEVSQGIGSNSV